MTIATLLLICLIFLILGRTGPAAMLTALTIAAVVCIASSNGGTTSQDLKTGYLVGATPSKQQWAILIGAVTSALVIGVTMLAAERGRHALHEEGLPDDRGADRARPTPRRERPGKPYDTRDGQRRHDRVPRRPRPRRTSTTGRAAGPLPGGRARASRSTGPTCRSRAKSKKMDNGEDAPKEFTAPQPRLFANIIEGILGGTLEWALVITGVLIAIALELCGVSALPVAVGMYLSLGSTTPIFIGGMMRLVADRLRGKPKSEAETETSPGVLLASGYIAGGTLCGLIIAFFAFLPDSFNEALNLGSRFFSGGDKWKPDDARRTGRVSPDLRPARGVSALGRVAEKGGEW